MQKCKHFNDLDKLVCEAGIRYEDVVRWTFHKDVWVSYQDKYFPWVFPCINRDMEAVTRLRFTRGIRKRPL